MTMADFNFKPRTAAEQDLFLRADKAGRQLGPALAKLSDKNDQLLARVLFNCPKWHQDPTMIRYPGHADVIHLLGDAGLITTRKHFADLYPEGITAFEITDKGLGVLEAMLGLPLLEEAAVQRDWYRANSSYEGWMKRVRQESFERLLKAAPSGDPDPVE